MQKKYNWFLFCAFLYPNLILAEPTIELMKVEYIDAVKEIIAQCWFELHPALAPSVDGMRKLIQKFGWLKDIESFPQDYMNGGVFVVVIDDGIIVGMGAVKKIDDETAELRRVYLSKGYRRQGLGGVIVEKLIRIAREYGYKRLRLEVYEVQTQQAAISLYKKFGFYEVPSYEESDCQLSMEALICCS